MIYVKENILVKVSNMLNIEVELVESVTEIIPYIGKVYGIFKTRRLEHRLIKIEENLSKWETRIQLLEKSNLDIVRSQLFPLFLEILMDEAEEEKIKLLVNGFDSTINNDYLYNEKESHITFFEILQRLRIHEVEYFVSKYINNYETDDVNKGTQDEGFTEFIKNKLIQLGLIKSISGQGIVVGSIVQNNTSRRSLTLFGEKFYKFFQTNNGAS